MATEVLIHKPRMTRVQQGTIPLLALRAGRVSLSRLLALQTNPGIDQQIPCQLAIGLSHNAISNSFFSKASEVLPYFHMLLMGGNASRLVRTQFEVCFEYSL